MNGKQNTYNTYSVGDVIRQPHYATHGGFRVWKIIAVHLGGERQEGTYELIPIDVAENKPIQIPCLMLESNPGIERV